MYMTQMVNLRYDSNYDDKNRSTKCQQLHAENLILLFNLFCDITVTGSVSTNFTSKFNKNTLVLSQYTVLKNPI